VIQTFYIDTDKGSDKLRRFFGQYSDGNIRLPCRVLPSGESRRVSTERPTMPKVGKKIGQTYGRTDLRQTDALHLPLDAASVINTLLHR